ncbi:hypothetical protein [Gluconobacter cerinus]|uniref:hypothetical protein n=1 Tax=Gluconobacter cerinus TaxID=38307 RepID=UPI0011AED972|nr:hypothetical protein [Gluconobacter cerinus]
MQSRALPGEMPRVTLERLTGLHIGRPVQHDDASIMQCSADMPDMADGQHVATSVPARHHHGDGYCFLCPLLHIPTITIAFCIAFLLAILRVCYCCFQSAIAPRTMGRLAGVRPPATGPPTFVTA